MGHFIFQLFLLISISISLPGHQFWHRIYGQVDIQKYQTKSRKLQLLGTVLGNLRDRKWGIISSSPYTPKFNSKLPFTIPRQQFFLRLTISACKLGQWHSANSSSSGSTTLMLATIIQKLHILSSLRLGTWNFLRDFRETSQLSHISRWTSSGMHSRESPSRDTILLPSVQRQDYLGSALAAGQTCTPAAASALSATGCCSIPAAASLCSPALSTSPAPTCSGSTRGERVTAAHCLSNREWTQGQGLLGLQLFGWFFLEGVGFRVHYNKTKYCPQQNIPIIYMENGRSAQKRYKKVVLTGLQIPQPPPLTPPKPPQGQASSKQQSIQKSSSSSEEQTYYENYFHAELEKLIQTFMGTDLEYTVLQLRESQSQEPRGQNMECLDVVLRVGVEQDDLPKFNQRIGQMKEEAKAKLKGKKSENDFSKKQKYFQEVMDNSDGYQASSRDLNADEQTLHNLRPRAHKPAKESEKKVKKDGKKTKYGKLEMSQNLSELQSTQARNTNKKRLRKGVIATFILILVVVSAIAFSYWRSAEIVEVDKPVDEVKQASQQQFKPLQVQKNLPYLGDVGQNFPKSTFFIPHNKQDESTKINIFIQILPAVTSPEQSLHPRNVSYIRPAIAKLLTFESVHVPNLNERRFTLEYLNFTHDPKEIQAYLEGLGRKGKSITQALYQQLKRNPDSPLLLQAQYQYLSRKYTLPSSPHLQKPLCILSGGSNLESSSLHRPFFESLLAQNYTKYRLVYIDEASEDEFEAVKIMKWVWDKFRDRVTLVGTDSFYFVRLDRKMGRMYSRVSLAREMCADGDIVVDLDATSAFVGRQALNVISAAYDGGTDRMMMVPKSRLELIMNPFYESKRPNLKVNPEQPGPPAQPQSSSQAKALDGKQSPMPKGLPPQFNEMEQKVFVPRLIHHIWAAYSNYFYEERVLNEKEDTENVTLVFVNSTETLTTMRNFYTKEKSIEGAYRKYKAGMGEKHVSNICLKTYAMPLQQKLPVSKVTSAPAQQRYFYSIEFYTSLLEMAGKFSSPAPNPAHSTQIHEPLCFRSDVVNHDKCQRMKRNFEELSFLNRNQMEAVRNVMGDGEAREGKNQRWTYDEFVKFTAKVRAEMNQLCGNR